MTTTQTTSPADITALETKIADVAETLAAMSADPDADQVLGAELEAQHDELVAAWVRASDAAGRLAA